MTIKIQSNMYYKWPAIILHLVCFTFKAKEEKKMDVARRHLYLRLCNNLHLAWSEIQ